MELAGIRIVHNEDEPFFVFCVRMKKNPEALTGIRLKLKRAWEQLHLLKTDITAFLDDRPYRPTVHFNKKTSRLTVKVQVNKSPDPIWSVRVGEIVHNFRSALDHLVWELAGRPTARTSKTQFPIFETEPGFSNRQRQYLKDVPINAIALIKAEQPFFIRKDGTAEGIVQSPLWHLKELSDIDKHRTIHLTGTALSAYNFKMPVVAQPFTLMDVYEHPGGPIQQDTILWSGILRGATDWPFAQRDTHAGFEVDVAFEDGTPVTGLWGVHGTLAQLGNRSERIIRTVVERVFKSEL